jgi:hypothetical protein
VTLLLPVEPLAAGEPCEVANCGGRAPRTMGLTAGGRMLGLACQGNTGGGSHMFRAAGTQPHKIHQARTMLA